MNDLSNHLPDLPLIIFINNECFWRCQKQCQTAYYMRLKVTVSPNPFSNELFVSITSDVVLNAVLRLTDTNNNMVRMIGSPLRNGENMVQIKNLSKYVSGTYQLQIKLLNGELLETIEVVKE